MVLETGSDRGAHERTALIQTTVRAPRTLGYRDERVRVWRYVPMTIFLVLDPLLRRQVFEIALQVAWLQRLAKREFLRVPDPCRQSKDKKNLTQETTIVTSLEHYKEH